MATVHEIEQRLFSWAPRESAMDWDNVGHLVGDPEQEVEHILVALDITERVVQEAIDCGAQLIVCPPSGDERALARARDADPSARHAPRRHSDLRSSKTTFPPSACTRIWMLRTAA